jgi:hypothetical protein
MCSASARRADRDGARGGIYLLSSPNLSSENQQVYIPMPRYRPGAGKRVDNTSLPLIAHAKALGFDYETVNGTFDGVLAWGTVAICVDWKSPNGTLTPTQQKLVARGFPIRYISRPEQLDALRAELMQGRV